MLGQCFQVGDTGYAETVTNGERYQMYFTETIGNDLGCYGDPGSLSSQVDANPDFNANMLNTIAQTVCLVDGSKPASADINAGPNWLVRGSRTSNLGDDVEDDFSLCMNAMVSTILYHLSAIFPTSIVLITGGSKFPLA
jgi:hypothetical protein